MSADRDDWLDEIDELRAKLAAAEADAKHANGALDRIKQERDSGGPVACEQHSYIAAVAIAERDDLRAKLAALEKPMKYFYLDRIEDEGGVSGVGRVAEGVEFSNGWCALCWLTKHKSVAFYENIGEVEAIHGHGGKTRIWWPHTFTVNE
jgi:hypothetical protein